jgi:hypothetical protein
MPGLLAARAQPLMAGRIVTTWVATPATPPAGQGDTYLPLRELATYSGFSRRTLRTFLRRRLTPLPYYQIDGKIVVRRSEFDRWMASFRRGPILTDARDQAGQMVDEILRDLTGQRSQADNPARTKMGA